MLIGGIVAVVVVALVAAAAVLLRRSQDDAHSVEHYHRQLHTLEEIRSHPSVGDSAAAPACPETEEHDAAREAYPASAFRVSGTRTVRLTDLETPTVPPPPPPAVPNPGDPVKFDDTGAAVASGALGDGGPEEPRQSFMRGEGDKALHSIEHRPRRIGAPLAAIGVVTVLIIVLIVTGLHSDTKSPRHGSSSTATTTPVHGATTVPAHGRDAGTGQGHHPRTTTTTSTTAPSAVSAPTAASAHAATYDVALASYSLSLSASTGECWVEAEDPATRTVLFTGTLFAGQSHIVSVSGPVVVIAGAPAAFAATVNGQPVALPSGYQAPFTFTLETPAAGGAPATTPTT